MRRSSMIPQHRGFLSTPSGWRATDGHIQLYARTHRFLSTPSGWRATAKIIFRPRTHFYFYPRPPGGGRRSPCRLLSTLPRHFYPRPPGGGRRFPGALDMQEEGISVHALRVEGDSWIMSRPILCRYFYPRPPGGGRRCSSQGLQGRRVRFLSTPSGWRATL